MKKFLLVPLCALALSGCTAFCQLSENVPAYALVDEDQKPIASFVVCNVSYHLLCFIPFESGVTWKRPNFEDQPWLDIALFEDRATIDENLLSVKAALKRCNSNRVANLVTQIDDSSKWSLYLCRRHTVKTTCLILEPKED